MRSARNNDEENEEGVTAVAPVEESEIEASARVKLDKYFPEWEKKFRHPYRGKNTTLSELFHLCCNAIYPNDGLYIDLVTASKYGKLFSSTRENNFEDFMKIFDDEYLLTLQSDQSILDRGYELHRLLAYRIVDVCSRSIVQVAVALGHQDFLDKAYRQIKKELLLHGSSFDVISHTEATLAAMFNQSCLEDLTNENGGVNLKNSDGKSPLYYAIKTGCLDSLKILLKHDLDMDDYFRALSMAISCRRVEFLTLMLEKIRYTLEGEIASDRLSKFRNLFIEALQTKCPLVSEIFFNLIDNVDIPNFYSELSEFALQNQLDSLARKIYDRVIYYKRHSSSVSIECEFFHLEPGSSSLHQLLALGIKDAAYLRSGEELLFIETKDRVNYLRSENITNRLDLAIFDAIAKTELLTLNSSRVLTNDELNRITLATGNYCFGSLLDLSWWNEDFVIYVLTRNLPTISDDELNDTNMNILELLTSGADPTDVLCMFALPTKIHALFKARFAFDDAISAMLKGDDPNAYLTNCFSLAPEFIYSIFQKILSGETKLTCVDDDKMDDFVDTLSRSLLAIAKSLSDPKLFQIINGIIGMHLYSSSLHGFENREEKLFQALLYLRDAGRDDDHVNRTRVQVYNSLFNGSHSGLVSSLSMLSSNPQSSQCFRSSRYARLFPSQTTDDPVRRRIDVHDEKKGNTAIIRK